MMLYSFRRCPYAIRARLALKLAKINYEHREILLRDKPKEMLKVSPKGTVPVLILDDGRVVDESLDIMIFALGDIKRDLINICDGEFKKNLDLYKYKNSLEARDVCEKFLEKLESLLKINNQKQNISFHESLAILPFIRQFSKVDLSYFENLDFPNLQAWLKEFLESELFLSVMRKHGLYKPSSSF